MKPYLIALAVGLLVGVIYGLLNVRSPAPPVVALVGLLGILLGEQLPPFAKRLLADRGFHFATLHDRSGHQVSASLPHRAPAGPPVAREPDEPSA